jgi:signal peptidase I
MPQESSENFFTELLKFVLIAAAIVFPIRLFVAQPFIVSGASMDPTFHNGQYLIIDELSYRFTVPERGDVLIFRYPKNPKEFFIKRIIGLPGETVEIKSGDVYVTKTDGATVKLNETYVTNHGNGGDASYTIPADQYFVMGDNRPASSDSRVWGLLPKNDIVGRAFLRLLPVNTFGIFPGSTDAQ